MREQICLNGEWDFMPVYNVEACLDIPENLVFEKQKIRVPSIWKMKVPNDEGKNEFGVVDEFQPFNTFNYPEEWSKAETGVLHRRFTLPSSMNNSRIFLNFHGVAQKCRVYLNGSIIAEWNESYLPLRIDITKCVNKERAENELAVVCTCFEKITIPSGQQKITGLRGSWFGSIARGIWQDVFVESYSNVYIEDVFIKTSVRKHSISTSVMIDNTLPSPKELAVKIAIYDQKEPVKVFEGNIIKIGAGESSTAHIVEEWEDPKLWDMDSPHLYEMKVSIYEDTEIIDSKVIRFGFREIWVEGSHFILNGMRVNLRGDSWHFQGAVQQSKVYALNWYKLCRENGVNCVRLHAEPHPEYYLEAADEAGILIIDETAIYGSSKSMAADHPAFLDGCNKHIERLVKRDRNHPSIIMWSLENEMRWVDGRDTYKQYIPAMMDIIRKLDDTRPIILEGDNRLISKENAEVESMHYNIDGTIAQWERTKPLVFGEHGGWWYICPQNSSAYAGLKAYSGFDECVKGIAIKEKLFVEYARKNEVSGISTFNFVHYMMQSMPAHDVGLEYDQLDTPGCKPQVIRKNSLTLNNGLLEDEPLYLPNNSLEILREAFKPVSIIASEYNTSFFDDTPIIRNFDVYNDTLRTSDCQIDVRVRNGGNIIYEGHFHLIQKPGERNTIQIKFEPPVVQTISELTLEAVLYHQKEEMHRLIKKYKLYPSLLKSKKLDNNDKKVVYIGNKKCYDIIKNLIPDCERLKEFHDLTKGHFDVLVIGNYLDMSADKVQGVLGQFVENGGIAIQLEQFKFAPGELMLVKQSFFSAHMSDSNHAILKGLNDDDFMFWHPEVVEERPGDMIKQCFIKPVPGDINMLLECSSGDFGDGGDLWTPLFEYGYKKGTIIFNQLEMVDNYAQIPQACILLRNLLEYAISLKTKVKANVGLVATEENPSHRFIKGLGVEFDIVNEQENYDDYSMIIADVNNMKPEQAHKLRKYVQEGGDVLILPAGHNDEAILEKVLEEKVIIKEAPTFHLKKAGESQITSGISICDLFGFEKVHLSPRMVENKTLCENSVEIEGGEALLICVTGTPWHDYYIRNLNAEYSRIALVNMNKEKKQPELPYLLQKRIGKGRVIVSQISTDPTSEKNVRLYSRIIANLGGFIGEEAFSYIKEDKDYSVEYFMTLPYENYQNYKEVEAYYSDKEYSLNNLGEELYGWMKKVERSKEDGFINIPGSANKIYFLTCFMECFDDPCTEEQQDNGDCRIDILTNADIKAWLNGNLTKAAEKIPAEDKNIMIYDALMTKGINRFVIAATAGNEDIRIRPVFKNAAGEIMHNIKCRLTIDEVDPK